MQHLAPGTAEWPGGRIPDYVRDLTAVAIAVISRKGRLVDANAGFSILLSDRMAAADILDVRDLFAKPRFELFLMRQSTRASGALYSGIFDLGHGDGTVTSLQGKLCALDDDLLLVAELQIAGLELLRARVLALNEDLADHKRKLAWALSEARRQKQLAEKALAPVS